MERAKVKLHVFKPNVLQKGSPIVLDIHGGGWVSGDIFIDNYRNSYIAKHTPCIVVSVEYRLVSENVHFPEPLLDCVSAFLWLKDNAEHIGGDSTKIGVHGTSAGGNLAAGMSLYLRDHGLPQGALTVLNCPALSKVMTNSKRRFGFIF